MTKLRTARIAGCVALVVLALAAGCTQTGGTSSANDTSTDSETSEATFEFFDDGETLLTVTVPQGAGSVTYFGAAAEDGTVTLSSFSADIGDDQMDVTFDSEQRVMLITIDTMQIAITYNEDNTFDYALSVGGEVMFSGQGLRSVAKAARQLAGVEFTEIIECAVSTTEMIAASLCGRSETVFVDRLTEDSRFSANATGFCTVTLALSSVFAEKLAFCDELPAEDQPLCKEYDGLIRESLDTFAEKYQVILEDLAIHIHLDLLGQGESGVCDAPSENGNGNDNGNGACRTGTGGDCPVNGNDNGGEPPVAQPLLTDAAIVQYGDYDLAHVPGTRLLQLGGYMNPAPDLEDYDQNFKVNFVGFSLHDDSLDSVGFVRAGFRVLTETGEIFIESYQNETGRTDFFPDPSTLPISIDPGTDVQRPFFSWDPSLPVFAVTVQGGDNLYGIGRVSSDAPMCTACIVLKPDGFMPATR